MGTPFEAKAWENTKGSRVGEAVIVFRRQGEEFGRAYACCWGKYYNHHRTFIGMSCHALDKAIARSRQE